VVFLPRDAAMGVLGGNSVRLSVLRLSVCLSHACFVTNPKNLPAIFLHLQMKRQSFYFFLIPKISAKFQRGHPQWGRQIEVGVS